MPRSEQPESTHWCVSAPVTHKMLVVPLLKNRADSLQGVMPLAQRPVEQIIRGGGGTLFTGEDEVFAFKRAISRLVEMQTNRYLRASLLHHNVACNQSAEQ
jgi:hypothetical protein